MVQDFSFETDQLNRRSNYLDGRKLGFLPHHVESILVAECRVMRPNKAPNVKMTGIASNSGGERRRMHPHQELIEFFYTSFQRLDAEAMARCYHPDIRFSDPVFPLLSKAEVGDMWKMVCSQAKNFDLTFADIDANDQLGKARWEARYTFSATGRQVHNKIEAEFKFQEGKIIKHTDTFSFWKWSSMALGPVGFLLGWTPLLRRKVQKQARERLARFMNS